MLQCIASSPAAEFIADAMQLIGFVTARGLQGQGLSWSSAAGRRSILVPLKEQANLG